MDITLDYRTSKGCTDECSSILQTESSMYAPNSCIGVFECYILPPISCTISSVSTKVLIDAISNCPLSTQPTSRNPNSSRFFEFLPWHPDDHNSQEVLPALLPVLAPRLRPVAERLLNPEERASLATATDTMLAYGVRFDQRVCRVPAAAAGGAAAGMGGRAHVTHVPLDPPVDRMCAFQVGILRV